jgi:ribosomal protein S18 acetylase RimI-like enzyme
MEANEKKKLSALNVIPLTVHLRKLHTHAEFAQTYNLVLSINPELTKLAFEERQRALLAEGYQCYGVFTENNHLIAMCGYWIRHRFCYGKALHIDNVVTAPEMRHRGIASLLIKRITEEAKMHECKVVALDTYIDNKEAQQFYLKNDLHIAGLHFIYDVKD